MEDELREEAINDFLTRNFDNVSEEIENLTYEYVAENGFIELNYFYFSENEALSYIEKNLRDSKKTA